MDAKRMAKNKFRNSKFFRPFYQKQFAHKDTSICTKWVTKRWKENKAQNYNANKAKENVEWCCQNSSFQELDGSFKVLVDSQT